MVIKRIEWLDELRGIAIFLVVLGHVCQFGFSVETYSLLFRIIYSFHMPLFFFISGYARGLSEKNINIGVLARQLLLPFVTWAIIKSIVERDISLSRCLWVIQNPASGGLWFLWVLFFISIITCFIKEKFGSWISFLVCNVFLVVISFISHGQFGTWEMAVYFPYFVIGLSIRKIETFINRNFADINTVVLALLSLVLIYIRITFTQLDVYSSYPIDIAISLFICLFLYLFFERYTNHIGNYMSKVGQCTLGIYATHFYVLFVSRYLSNHFGYSYGDGLAILISIPVLFLSYIITKYIQYFQWSRFLLLGKK